MTPSTHRTTFRWLAATGGALVLASLTACAGHSQPVSQAATPLGSSGIGISGYQDLKVGDTIEGYIVKEVERTE